MTAAGKDRKTNNIVMTIGYNGFTFMKFQGRLHSPDGRTPTAMRDAISVFSKSAMMLKEYLKREKPEKIYFSGSDAEGKRHKLYKAMINAIEIDGYTPVETEVESYIIMPNGEKMAPLTIGHEKGFSVIRDDMVRTFEEGNAKPFMRPYGTDENGEIVYIVKETKIKKLGKENEG